MYSQKCSGFQEQTLPFIEVMPRMTPISVTLPYCIIALSKLCPATEDLVLIVSIIFTNK